MARPSIFTEAVVSTLLLAKASGKSNDAACADAGIHRDTLYYWLKTKPEFRKAFDRAVYGWETYNQTLAMKRANAIIEERLSGLMADFRTPAAA